MLLIFGFYEVELKAIERFWEESKNENLSNESAGHVGE